MENKISGKIAKEGIKKLNLASKFHNLITNCRRLNMG